MAGIAVVILVSRLLELLSGIRRHQQIIVTSTAMFIKNEIAPDFFISAVYPRHPPLSRHLP